jgi:hypothetical protein
VPAVDGRGHLPHSRPPRVVTGVHDPPSSARAQRRTQVDRGETPASAPPQPSARCHLEPRKVPGATGRAKHVVLRVASAPVEPEAQLLSQGGREPPPSKWFE